MNHVVEDMMERLDAVSRDFDQCLCLFGTTDYLSQRCLAHDKVGRITRMERPIWIGENPKPCKEVEGETLGLPESHYNLILAPLTLHWCEDIHFIFHQIHNALRPDGLFSACVLGSETLHELRHSLGQAESELQGGMASRVDIFPSLSQWGGFLQQTGFTLPVADKETVTIRYDNVQKLIDDIRNMGGGNRNVDKDHCLNRAIVQRMSDIYHSQFCDEDGRIRASFEIIFLSGWKEHESQQKPLKPGSAQMPLAEALKGN